MHGSRVAPLAIACATACALGFLVAASAAPAEPAAEKQASAAERAAQKLERVRAEPLALHDFLKRMPKGADLHNHLDGAVYAETFIRVGAEDELCVDTAAKAFSKSQPIEAGSEPQPVCEAGDVPAAEAYKNQRLYDDLVDSFSMRCFVASEAITGHDHFFGTFAKFGGTNPRHTGEFLDEVSARAAAQNEQYLELMETPTWHRLNDITKGVAWREDLASLRDELLAKGLADDLPAARAFWDEAESIRAQKQRCGEPARRPPARSRRVMSIRCSARLRRSCSLPKRCSGSSLRQPIRGWWP